MRPRRRAREVRDAFRCGVATRNVRDFEDCGLELGNPFELSA